MQFRWTYFGLKFWLMHAVFLDVKILSLVYLQRKDVVGWDKQEFCSRSVLKRDHTKV